MGEGASGRGEIGSTMRDAGLELAIKAAGGVASLARGIGIAQPSVSAWSRIPAERVLAVEALTQVNRFVLRPDLYGSSEDQVTSKPEIDEIDQLRAAEYGLLSLLLGKAPDAETLKRVATLKGDGSDLGMAHIELAAAAAATDDRAVSKEFFDLFIGLGRGELLPYASYYLTGFLHERPLARVREDLRALGIERAGTSREPEDHALSCSRSWLASHATTSRLSSPNRRVFSNGISSRGRRGCSPIWRCRHRRASTAPSAAPAVSSWNWNPRPSRCPSDGERRREKGRSQ